MIVHFPGASTPRIICGNHAAIRQGYVNAEDILRCLLNGIVIDIIPMDPDPYTIATDCEVYGATPAATSTDAA